MADPQDEDVILIVDNATTNPVNKKITLDALFNKRSSNVSSTSTTGKIRVKRDITVRRDINVRNASSIETPQPINVAGIDDISTSGTYTGSDSSVFAVVVDAEGSPDTFRWSKNGGSFTTGVAITGSSQTLSDGVNIRFGDTTDHLLGDAWYITAIPPSKIDFGPGLLLVDDTSTSTPDFSELGHLQLESGIDLKLEGGGDSSMYITSNTTTIQVIGNQAYGNTSNKLGFYGVDPVTQNTSSGSMTTVSHLKTELIRLGLIL